MPVLTRWMVKTSLVYLVLALFTGILTGMKSAFQLAWIPGGLTPGYIHLFMVGWVSLLIFGIVFWMFPKYTLERPRRSERLGWVVFGCINTGLILRVIGESMLVSRSPWGWLLVVSAVLQLAGGLAFVINTWQRVKEK